MTAYNQLNVLTSCAKKLFSCTSKLLIYTKHAWKFIKDVVNILCSEGNNSSREFSIDANLVSF